MPTATLYHMQPLFAQKTLHAKQQTHFVSFDEELSIKILRQKGYVMFVRNGYTANSFALQKAVRRTTAKSFCVQIQCLANKNGNY